MIIYLLRSTLCLLVLLCFYKWILEDEKMLIFKRFYLLGSLAFSLILPLMTIALPSISIGGSILEGSDLGPMSKDLYNLNTDSIEKSYNYTTVSLFVFYSLGAVFFCGRFFRNFSYLLLQVKQNKILRHRSYSIVLTEDDSTPFSFLKFIFLNKKDFFSGRIKPEIIEHERAHVEQKHSWDIILVEFLHAVFWFNPLFILLKKSIRMNHEFLADQKIIVNRGDPYSYMNLLLSFSKRNEDPSLSSSFSQFELRKRIEMISRKYSKRDFSLCLGLLVPVLGICFFLFSNVLKSQVQHLSSENENKSVFYVNAYVYENNKIQIQNKQVSLDEIENEVRELLKDHPFREDERIIFRIFADEKLKLGVIMDVEQKMFLTHNQRASRLRMSID